MNILALGASNSRSSINKRFATFAAKKIENAQINIIDLNDYEMPLYSIDREKEDGIPSKAQSFKKLLQASDKVIISFAEHNGSYSVAFKNVMDWISRIEGDTWESKIFFLMSTSPGGRGGKTVLDTAIKSFGHMGANVVASFSLPSFHKNYNEDEGIVDEELNAAFQDQLKTFVIS